MSKHPYNQADDFADRDMTARHNAARNAESTQRFRDFSSNAEALSASQGFSSGRFSGSRATFDEIQTSRSELVAKIKACELLDTRLRDNLAFELMMVDTTTLGTKSPAGRSFESVAMQFRDVVAKSHPEKSVDDVLEDELELKWIAADLQWLIDRMTFLKSL